MSEDGGNGEEDEDSGSDEDGSDAGGDVGFFDDSDVYDGERAAREGILTEVEQDEMLLEAEQEANRQFWIGDAVL